MATYKEIKGVTIQTNTKDPVIGGVAGGTWAAGGDLLAATMVHLSLKKQI